MTADLVVRRLRASSKPSDAVFFARYFKTAPGEYGAGDRFLGVRVPAQRAVAGLFRDLPLPQLDRLLQSPWHEARATALIIMCNRYARRSTTATTRTALFRLYVRRMRFINNWDLIDGSAPRIVGAQLFGQNLRLLDKLAVSTQWNRRRVAVMATMFFIQRRVFDPTLSLAERLMNDPHDLLHKAVGWMLREIGQRDLAALRRFLARFASRMPRTMLRYAIEKLDADERKKWMGAKPA